MATENVKKTKASAKAKSAAKAAGETEVSVKAASAVRAKKPAKAPAKVETVEVAPVAPTHSEIAQLAQRFWAERGWQDGFAEQDWLRAERELMRIAS